MPRKLNVIGSQVRSLRMQRGLTQEQLAAKCGVLGWDISTGILSKVESHLRSAFDCELIILAKALRVSVGDLMPERLSRVWLQECLNKPARMRKRRIVGRGQTRRSVL